MGELSGTVFRAARPPGSLLRPARPAGPPSWDLARAASKKARHLPRLRHMREHISRKRTRVYATGMQGLFRLARDMPPHSVMERPNTTLAWIGKSIRVVCS